jgi:L-tartrate/succinate antiporter
MNKSTLLRVAIPLALGCIIALIPAPHDLNQNAWYFFALFAAVVAGLILEPIPAAAIGFLGVFLTASMDLVAATPEDSIRWALSGFSNSTVWLIFGAFMFAMGYEKTGLGKRLALALVKAMGKRTLGLGYAITFADLILAPFITSNTARSGGIVYPVVRNLPGLYDSFPGPSLPHASPVPYSSLHSPQTSWRLN